MIDKEKIEGLVEEKLAGTDYYLVDVTVRPGNVIVVEIDHDQAVDIDFCVELSRFIEGRLDRDVEDFELEVGSAGLSAPFKILRQYQKNVGNEVEVLLNSGVKMTGVLAACDADGITLAVEKLVKPEGAKRKTTVVEEHSFPYSDIKYTKYVIRFK